MSFAVPLSPSEGPRTSTVYLQITPRTWALISVVSAILATLSTEPALTLGCLIAVIAGAKLLWRQGEPPILFAAFFLQWLQVSVAVFRASVYGVGLSDLYFSEGAYLATWFSLIGLLMLAAGIRLALSDLGQRGAWRALVIEAQQCSLRKAVGAYWIAQVVVVGIEAVTWWYPGLSQPLIALSNFRWIFFFFVAIIVFVQKRGYWLLLLLLVFEIVRGFLSFFSDYKDVFLVLALAYLTARPKITARTLVVISLILGAVLVLSAAWSIVKMDYRKFLTGGTGRQVIVVGTGEQLATIGDLMINNGLPRLSEGFDQLAKRVEYTYYFGLVVERVPNVLPHEYGTLWGAAIMHVLTPRLLFPDKPMLAAEVLTTQRYTGLMLAWKGNEDTEIPLGYMAESYIDFGAVGMFVPILLLGVLFGAQYRYIVTRTQYLMFAFGAAPVVVMPATHYEMGVTKILGSSIMTFVVFVIAFRLIAPHINRLVRG